MEIITPEILIKNIERLISEDSRNLQNISRISGIAPMTITNIRKGKVKTLALSTINKLCIYFGITPDTLFLDEDSVELILKEHDKVSITSEIAAIEKAKAELELKLIELRERNAIADFEHETKKGSILSDKEGVENE